MRMQIKRKNAQNTSGQTNDESSAKGEPAKSSSIKQSRIGKWHRSCQRDASFPTRRGVLGLIIEWRPTAADNGAAEWRRIPRCLPKEEIRTPEGKEVRGIMIETELRKRNKV
ncbi:hypothetical protein L596_024149 [Steinernema carpocapsae]|uniref:Uncharacterized protein n=1 Tax=Steinernema carpocapsae TaxID=34508 RepID=A0A4U5MFV4_STECR|nr:hypothetical protein L596_024149 [Steinernema carpocapsae]